MVHYIINVISKAVVDVVRAITSINIIIILFWGWSVEGVRRGIPWTGT